MIWFRSGSPPWFLFLSDDEFSDDAKDCNDEDNNTEYDDFNPLNHDDDVKTAVLFNDLRSDDHFAKISSEVRSRNSNLFSYSISIPVNHEN